MKLTEDQLVLLQETLNDRLQYIETYDEVYDHVLTALEDVDDNIPLGEAVNTVMLNDFGGFKGLKKIESERRWTVTRHVAKNQLGYFIDNFKFPLLPLTGIIYALMYYVVITFQFIPGFFSMQVSAIILSSLYLVYRYHKTGFGRTKSIKDFSYHIVGLAPYYSYVATCIIVQVTYYEILDRHDFSEWFSPPPMFLSSLYTFYIIYAISFFRLCRNEFTKLQIK